jgi:hypothetical protein
MSFFGFALDPDFALVEGRAAGRIHRRFDLQLALPTRACGTTANGGGFR